MNPSEITGLVVTILGSGVFGAIISGFISAKKLPIEKRSSEIQNASVANQIALDTLKSVDEKYKETIQRYEKLETRVELLQKEFEDQSTLFKKLQGYIKNILNNWDTLRHNEHPPELPFGVNQHFERH